MRWRRPALQPGLFGVAGAAIALIAWYPGHWPIALLALPFAWSAAPVRLPAGVLWAGYYLTGARDIPVMCERFFAGHGEMSASGGFALGIAFWLGQALVLTAPWAILKPRVTTAGHAWRAILATLLVSVPPLGVIGWLSPVHVSSTLYPGWQLTGLLLGMAALATAAAVRHSRIAAGAAVVLLVSALIAHMAGPEPRVPLGWMALDTTLGRLDQSKYTALYARTRAVMDAADRGFAIGAEVIVLPEEVIGLWRPAMRYWWADYLQRLAGDQKTVILGADLVASSGPIDSLADARERLRYTDSAVVAGANRGRFDSRQPVPAGLWRPGGTVSAVLGDLAQPYLSIARKRVAISICYEDFLWWPHWRLLIARPDVLVDMSNGWFNGDLAIAAIQRQSMESIARLANVPLLRAVNR
jgi:apolipoprotein N-acyltransferase